MKIKTLSVIFALCSAVALNTFAQQSTITENSSPEEVMKTEKEAEKIKKAKKDKRTKDKKMKEKKKKDKKVKDKDMMDKPMDDKTSPEMMNK